MVKILYETDISPEAYCQCHFYEIYNAINRAATDGRKYTIKELDAPRLGYRLEDIREKILYDNTNVPIVSGGHILVKIKELQGYKFSPKEIIEIIMGDINKSAKDRNKNYAVHCRKKFHYYEFMIHPVIGG